MWWYGYDDCINAFERYEGLPKLTSSDDYFHWRDRIEILLKQHEVWDVVIGEAERPEITGADGTTIEKRWRWSSPTKLDSEITTDSETEQPIAGVHRSKRLRKERRRLWPMEQWDRKDSFAWDAICQTLEHQTLYQYDRHSSARSAAKLWSDIESREKPTGFYQAWRYIDQFRDCHYADHDGEGEKAPENFIMALERPCRTLRGMGAEYAIPKVMVHVKFVESVREVLGPIFRDFFCHDTARGPRDDSERGRDLVEWVKTHERIRARRQERERQEDAIRSEAHNNRRPQRKARKRKWRKQHHNGVQ